MGHRRPQHVCACNRACITCPAVFLAYPILLRENSHPKQEEEHIGEVSIAPPFAGVREFAHVTTGSKDSRRRFSIAPPSAGTGTDCPRRCIPLKLRGIETCRRRLKALYAALKG